MHVSSIALHELAKQYSKLALQKCTALSTASSTDTQPESRAIFHTTWFITVTALGLDGLAI
jgi:hypothetical protein